MGFFSKVWKGIKTGVKGVVKGVKKAFKSVGKFFGKLGIVGQLALMFLLPGSGFLSGMGSWAAKMGAYTGFGAPVVNAAGKFLTAAVRVGNTITKPFRTIASGVMDVVKNTVGAIANKIPGMDTFVSRLTKGRIDINDYSFKNAFDAVGKTLTQTAADVGTIFTPDKWELPKSFAAGFDKETAIQEVLSTDPTKFEDIKTSIREGGLDSLTTEQRTLYDQAAGQGVHLGDGQSLNRNIIDIDPIGTNEVISTNNVTDYRFNQMTDSVGQSYPAGSYRPDVNQINKNNSILAQPDVKEDLVVGSDVSETSEDVSQDKGYIQSKIDTGIERASDKITKVMDDPLGALAGVMGRQNDPILQQGVYSYSSTPTYGELEAPPSSAIYNQGQSPNALAFLGGQPASMLGLYHPFLINEAWRTG
tara:strand:+ start:38 stop:1288 length:1251 start_codon:yes stop_codon:yes gene_type:complete